MSSFLLFCRHPLYLPERIKQCSWPIQPQQELRKTKSSKNSSYLLILEGVIMLKSWGFQVVQLLVKKKNIFQCKNCMPRCILSNIRKSNFNRFQTIEPGINPSICWTIIVQSKPPKPIELQLAKKVQPCNNFTLDCRTNCRWNSWDSTKFLSFRSVCLDYQGCS